MMNDFNEISEKLSRPVDRLHKQIRQLLEKSWYNDVAVVKPVVTGPLTREHLRNFSITRFKTG